MFLLNGCRVTDNENNEINFYLVLIYIYFFANNKFYNYIPTLHTV